jgi:hypothetical protein
VRRGVSGVGENKIGNGKEERREEKRERGLGK